MQERHMKVKAVILAGGKGTRLRTLSQGLPKALVPVNGKPLLEYQFELLARHGASRSRFLCGYGAAAIAEFAAMDRAGAATQLHRRSSAQLGTAGAVMTAFVNFRTSFLCFTATPW